MDGQRFDNLARFLAARTSRRSAIRAVLGSSAGMLGRARTRQVGAQECKVDCAECQFFVEDPETGDCGCEDCFGRVPDADPTSIVCCSGTCLFQEICSCPGGCLGDELCCDGTCVSLFDPANCGACGRACPPTQICSRFGSFFIQCGCPEGATACGETCADLLTDPAHCGTCETACATGQACVNGVCQSEPSGEEPLPSPVAMPTAGGEMPTAAPAGPIGLPGTGAGGSEKPSQHDGLPLIGAAAALGAALAARLLHRLRSTEASRK